MAFCFDSVLEPICFEFFDQFRAQPGLDFWVDQIRVEVSFEANEVNLLPARQLFAA